MPARPSRSASSWAPRRATTTASVPAGKPRALGANASRRTSLDAVALDGAADLARHGQAQARARPPALRGKDVQDEVTARVGPALAEHAVELGAAREPTPAWFAPGHGTRPPDEHQTVRRLRPLSRRRLRVRRPARVLHAGAKPVGACALALLWLVGAFHGVESRTGEAQYTQGRTALLRAAFASTPARRRTASAPGHRRFFPRFASRPLRRPLGRHAPLLYSPPPGGPSCPGPRRLFRWMLPGGVACRCPRIMTLCPRGETIRTRTAPAASASRPTTSGSRRSSCGVRRRGADPHRARPGTRQWISARYGRLLERCARRILGDGRTVAFSEDAPPRRAAARRRARRSRTAAGPRESFNPRYSFEQFIIGEGNRLAHAAALSRGRDAR